MRVVDLQKYRPHVTIKGQNAVHVLPLSIFVDIAKRRMKLTDIEQFDDIVPSIISDWLLGLTFSE